MPREYSPKRELEAGGLENRDSAEKLEPKKGGDNGR